MLIVLIYVDFIVHMLIVLIYVFSYSYGSHGFQYGLTTIRSQSGEAAHRETRRLCVCRDVAGGTVPIGGDGAVSTVGAFHSWGYPNIDGYKGKLLEKPYIINDKWMIWEFGASPILGNPHMYKTATKKISRNQLFDVFVFQNIVMDSFGYEYCWNGVDHFGSRWHGSRCRSGNALDATMAQEGRTKLGDLTSPRGTWRTNPTFWFRRQNSGSHPRVGFKQRFFDKTLDSSSNQLEFLATIRSLPVPNGRWMVLKHFQCWSIWRFPFRHRATPIFIIHFPGIFQ